MMIIPLPTFLLDILLTINISLGVLILLVAIYIPDALSIASFPTILLVTTLYRLALNVSSTRLILLQADAGEVIRAFGTFVVGGNYVVGGIVFLILTLIQFIVIAKGSERVSEVAARFTLDAMPGKQMSIDADLRAGAFDLDEARRRRRLLQRESQFYGAMDGAMKFVKGDAIAGILITFINILGGLAIGVLMRDMNAGDSLVTYGLLTIGDGLVSQIPALVISTAAGMVVTRVASEEAGSALGAEIGSQILAQPKALAITGGLLLALAAVPGLPAVPFVILGATALVAARGIHRSQARAIERARQEATAPVDRTRAREEARAPLAVPLILDLGKEIDPLARPEKGGENLVEDLLPAVRERMFDELGVQVPQIRVRAPWPELEPEEYEIRLHEVPVARGRLPKGTPPKVIAENVLASLRRYASELVGIQEVQTMLDALDRTHPALVRAVVPKPVSTTLLADLLRRLVDEQVSIRNLREILEALAQFAPVEKDPVVLTEHVRSALRRALTHRYAHDGTLACFRLAPEIEEAIRDAIQRTPSGNYLALAPDLGREIVGSIVATLAANPDAPRILLTQMDVRRYVRRLIELESPDTTVLSVQEISPEVRIQPVARVEMT
ncbi:MAG: FHIPEP family type III secretion protein [Deltaproteobacteria bacterium]|nr:FHIPEP family type III secretion protein [Deltaproteobacteria bacterium]